MSGTNITHSSGYAVRTTAALASLFNFFQSRFLYCAFVTSTFTPFPFVKIFSLAEIVYLCHLGGVG
jgi:hypothetical protein